MSEKSQESRYHSLTNREKRVEGIFQALWHLASKDIVNVDTHFLGFKARFGGIDVRIGRRSEVLHEDLYFRASELIANERDRRKLFGAEDAGIHVKRVEEDVRGIWLGSVEDVAAMEEGEPHKKGFPNEATDTQLIALSALVSRADVFEENPTHHG